MTSNSINDYAHGARVIRFSYQSIEPLGHYREHYEKEPRLNDGSIRAQRWIINQLC